LGDGDYLEIGYVEQGLPSSNVVGMSIVSENKIIQLGFLSLGGYVSKNENIPFITILGESENVGLLRAGVFSTWYSGECCYLFIEHSTNNCLYTIILFN